MRHTEKRLGRAAMLALAVVGALALATLASAGTVGHLLAQHAPLPPARASNPSGEIPNMTAAERSRATHRIGRSRLVIPSVGMNAPWVRETLDGSQLGVPEDVHVAGLWAAGGQITGHEGTVLMDGHVNYIGQGNGALYVLSRVRPGALIGTSTHTGQTVWWRAVRVVRMLKQALPQTIFTDTGARRLVIVTCGGILETDGHYDDNVVLYARPVVSPPRARLGRAGLNRGGVGRPGSQTTAVADHPVI